MEHNPGDSSSESDISDPWSIIDGDSCESEDIGLPVDNSLRDIDSVSGEPSDGESLEVIDEEEKHDEYKDADMDTDGISIITESEINDELEHPLSLAVSKERKYLHHPNTYLNTRLNVLLAISFAAVTGLGLGHFLGLQEECPLLNESTANLVAKLQHDNELLRNQLEKLLNEKVASAVKETHNVGCGAGVKFKKEGVIDFQPSLQDDIMKQSFHWKTNIPSVTQLDRDKIVPVLTATDSLNKNIAIEIVSEQPETNIESNTFTDDSESVILGEDGSTIAVDMVGLPNIKSNEKSAHKFSLQVDDVALVQPKFEFHAHSSIQSSNNDDDDDAKFSILTNEQKVVATSSFLTKDEKNVAESSGHVLHSSVHVEDEVFVLSVDDSDAFEDHEINTKSFKDKSIPTSPGHETNEAFIQQNEKKANVGSDSPQIIPERKEIYPWEEKNIEIIKLTLKLLQAYFDNDIVSPNTGNILTSAVTLTTDLQKNFVQLQESISDCQVQRNEFCLQFQKRMEVSVKKLEETTEGLVDNIDEQMYKLLNKIVRKLKKYKGNFQDKWCHLADKYASESDAVYNWLHSIVLLECKESDGQSKKKSNQYSFKESGKLGRNIIMDVKERKTKDIPKVLHRQNMNRDNLIKIETNTSPSVGDKHNDKHIKTDKFPQAYESEEHIFDKIEINHDHSNEEHLKMDTLVIVPETFKKQKTLKQEQYMANSYGNWKHDSVETFKGNGFKKKKYENKETNVPHSKTCWQANDGKTFCQKFENKLFSNSQKLKDQHVRHGKEDNHWYEKRNPKDCFNNNGRKHYKKENREKGSRLDPKQSIILEKNWVVVDAKNDKHSNVSGDWILKMSSGRAEHRKLEHKSDWLFDRADARKLKRERHHKTGNWYFQRARGREYCRYYPNSNWCKSGTYNGPDYDWLHQNDHQNEYNEHERLHHGTWKIRPKKFMPRTFAAAGKWMKDTFSNFQSKFNYHSHR